MYICTSTQQICHRLYPNGYKVQQTKEYQVLYLYNVQRTLEKLDTIHAGNQKHNVGHVIPSYSIISYLVQVTTIEIYKKGLILYRDRKMFHSQFKRTTKRNI